MSHKERELLESFVVDNEDLDKLEAKLAQFNIFEAIGVVRQEVRHSNFLSFLLNPSQNHRLDDIFLKRLLKRVLLEADEPTELKDLKISPIDIDIADLKDAEVHREWKHIDILIYSPSNHLVCAIENKIDSGEHSNQLQRYRKNISKEYGDCRAILIYLSPEGTPPSDEKWIAYSYSKIAELVDNIRENYKSTLGADVYTLMLHYSHLIRRHVVSDSEIAELCRKIYRKHKQALDLIFEHRPDLQLEFSEKLKEIANQHLESHQIILGNYAKNYVNFYPKEWEGLPILFHFLNLPDRLLIQLFIFSGDNSLRKLIHQASLKNLDIFRKGRWSERWITIYKKEILKPSDYEDTDVDSLMMKVQASWAQFLTHDLPKIREIITKISWTDLESPVNTYQDGKNTLSL
jgi:hypothetical protein